MANTILPGLGFHHIALKVRDFERSKAFYQALGLQFLVEWGEGDQRIAMLEFGEGGILELFAGGGDDLSENGKWLHLALSVDDVDAAYRIALEAGAVSVKPPKDAAIDGRPFPMLIHIAFVKGFDGEEIEFFHRVK